MDVRAIADDCIGCERHARRTNCGWATLLVYFFSLLPLTASAEDETQCLQQTAVRYALPLTLLHAIREVEGGRPGFWRRNLNGSYDYGVMQINSVWLPRLQARGYDAYVLTHDPCASIEVAGWILAGLLMEAGHGVALDAAHYWQAVGRYHSKTASLNRAYAERVWNRMEQGGGVLGARQKGTSDGG